MDDWETSFRSAAVAAERMAGGLEKMAVAFAAIRIRRKIRLHPHLGEFSGLAPLRVRFDR